jgi:two-component system LytT family sensor kinase
MLVLYTLNFCFNIKNFFLVGRCVLTSGLGITNTKRRLEILYPKKHQLEITDSGDSFEINLVLLDV